MFKTILIRSHSLFALAVAGLFSTGCSSDPQAYSIAVELDKPLIGMSLQVDIIAARGKNDLPLWESTSVSDYWQPDNVRRRDADKVTLVFDKDQPKRAIFTKKDAHWEKWLAAGTRSLVIMADIPGVIAPKSGGEETRRRVLPLEEGTWDDVEEDVIEILIQEGGIRVLTKTKK